MLVLKSHVPVTAHYEVRAAKRGLRPRVAEFVMLWGTSRRAAGATHITLVDHCLPPDVRASDLASRARGWILVLGDDGALITCYRRRDAWRFIGRKSRPRRWAREA